MRCTFLISPHSFFRFVLFSFVCLCRLSVGLTCDHYSRAARSNVCLSAASRCLSSNEGRVSLRLALGGGGGGAGASARAGADVHEHPAVAGCYILSGLLHLVLSLLTLSSVLSYFSFVCLCLLSVGLTCDAVKARYVCGAMLYRLLFGINLILL